MQADGFYAASNPLESPAEDANRDKMVTAVILPEPPIASFINLSQ